MWQADNDASSDVLFAPPLARHRQRAMKNNRSWSNRPLLLTGIEKKYVVSKISSPIIQKNDSYDSCGKWKKLPWEKNGFMRLDSFDIFALGTKTEKHYLPPVIKEMFVCIPGHSVTTTMASSAQEKIENDPPSAPELMPRLWNVVVECAGKLWSVILRRFCGPANKNTLRILHMGFIESPHYCCCCRRRRWGWVAWGAVYQKRRKYAQGFRVVGAGL